MKDHAQRFFGLWHEFRDGFERAAKENVLFREEHEKADKTKSADNSEQPTDSIESAPKRDLFSQFSKSQEGDASEIVAKFRNRKRNQGDQSNPKHRKPGLGFDVTNELALKLSQRRNCATQRKSGENNP